MDNGNSEGQLESNMNAPSDIVVPSKALGIEDLKTEGCLLWAKIKGYSYWPAIVTVDPIDGMTVKITENSSRCRVHVHFLGYADMRAWVPYVNVILFEGKVSYDKLAATAKNIKDYYPTKKYMRLFEKAVNLAEETNQCPQESRLKKLGLVYVLIDSESDSQKDSKDTSTIEKNPSTNGNSNVPKITTGFFKNYQPILSPETKPEKSKDDVFDFDDSKDQFKVDFKLNNEESDLSEKHSPKKLSISKKSKTLSGKKKKADLNGSHNQVSPVHMIEPEDTLCDEPLPKKLATAKKAKPKSDKKMKTGSKTQIDSDSSLSMEEQLATMFGEPLPEKLAISKKSKMPHGKKKKSVLDASKNQVDTDSSTKKKSMVPLEKKKKKKVVSDSAKNLVNVDSISLESQESTTLSEKIPKKLVTSKKFKSLSEKKKKNGSNSNHDDSKDQSIAQKETLVLNDPLPPKNATPKKLKPSPGKRKLSDNHSGSSSKKRKVSSSKVKVTSHDEAEVTITDLEEIAQDDDDFKDNTDNSILSLGSLIWGRMAGFPYWPCFVTKSPGGDLNRVFGKRKEYHAQFFNWNNESGWVCGAKPWCPIDQYQKKAKVSCPKGPNTPEGRIWYPPARLANRWKNAVIEAQKTAHLTKRERYNSLVVSYGGFDKKKAPRTVVAKKHLLSKQEMPNNSTKIANDGDIDKVVEPLELNRPCPASKKKVFLKSGLSLGKIELPKGWSYEPWKEDEKTVLLKLQSPEGIVYEGVENAIAHLLQQNCCPPGNIQRLRRRSFSASSCLQKEEPERFGWFLRCTDRMHFNIRPYCPDQVGQLEGPVQYLKDESLPAAWLVRKIRGRNETLYQSTSTFHKTSNSPSEMRFKDKVNVARFLEGMGHPALEIEQLLFNYPNIARVAPRDLTEEEEEDKETLNEEPAINLNDVLTKTLTPCYVEIVKLPDIFLRHPCVRVKESNNEMMIRDAISDAFIAKKIIYD